MKTQITRTFIAMMLLFAAFGLKANDNKRSIELTTVKQKAVVLKLDNVKEGTKVSLKNENGALLFEDKVQGNNYGKVFNLQKLAQGNLTLEVENEELLEVLPIEVTSTSAEMVRKKCFKISKPLVKHNDGVLKVYLDENCEGMKMSIFDNQNDVAFRDDIDANGTQLKRYDISDLSEGKYRIQFSVEGRSFYHTITL